MNTANLVDIDRYHCVRLLQARVVSVITTNYACHLLIIFCRASLLGLSLLGVCAVFLQMNP